MFCKITHKIYNFMHIKHLFNDFLIKNKFSSLFHSVRKFTPIYNIYRKFKTRLRANRIAIVAKSQNKIYNHFILKQLQYA